MKHSDTYFQTSDGEQFYKECDARAHAKKLTDKSITPVAADGSGEIANIIEADAPGEETPAELTENLMALAAGLSVVDAENVGLKLEGDTPPAPAEPANLKPVAAAQKTTAPAAQKPAAKKTPAKKPADKKPAPKKEAAPKPAAADTTIKTE